MTPEQKLILGARRAATKHLLVHEMRLRGHTSTSLARALGVTHQSIYKTVSGLMHSPRVLDALRELGVPQELLHDPRYAAPPKIGKAS